MRWQAARRSQSQGTKARILLSWDTPRLKTASGSARIPSHGADSQRCTKDNSEAAGAGTGNGLAAAGGSLGGGGGGGATGDGEGRCITFVFASSRGGRRARQGERRRAASRGSCPHPALPAAGQRPLEHARLFASRSATAAAGAAGMGLSCAATRQREIACFKFARILKAPGGVLLERTMEDKLESFGCIGSQFG